MLGYQGLIVAIGMALVGPDGPGQEVEPPLPRGTLAEQALDVTQRGEAAVLDVVPDSKGAYNVLIRYGPAMGEILMRTMRTPHDPHPLHPKRGPLHESFGARVRLVVSEAESGTILEPVRENWSSCCEVGPAGRFASQALEFELARGVASRAVLHIDRPSEVLQKYDPRLFVEMTPETLSNAALMRTLFRPFRR